MKRYALLLALTTMGMAADSPNTYLGIVMDNQQESAGTISHFANQCAVVKGPRYTLQTATDAWVLSDEKTAAKYVGKTVDITGVVADGNRLNIKQIRIRE